MTHFNRRLPYPTLTALLLTLSIPAAPFALAAETSRIPPGSLTQERAILERTSEAFNQVAQLASPAVVSISAVKTAAPDTQNAPMFMPDQPNEAGVGIGSGVIIRADGIVLTNNHVVENAERVSVIVGENRKLKARILGSDPSTDIAILKITDPVKELPTIAFGDSDKVKVGDWAVAIGAPFGLNQSVTSGIISAKGRSHLGAFDMEDFIQTDAAINPGNSGGPLLNLRGEMVGLNAAIFSQSGGFIGIGFSIPSNIARAIASEIIQKGRVVRGWIGVIAQDMDEDLATYFKVPGAKGALVSDLTRGGPAARSKLQIGDVIYRYGRREVTDSSALKALVAKTKRGTRVPVEVVRDGKRQNLEIHVSESPHAGGIEGQMAGTVAKRRAQPKIGLALQDVPSEFQRMLGLTHSQGALIVGVEPGSMAFDAGLEAGDVILKADGQAISNAADFVKRTRKATQRDLTMLYVQRGPDEKVFIPLKRQSEG